MNKKKVSIALSVILAAGILPAGFIAFSMGGINIGGYSDNTSPKTVQQTRQPSPLTVNDLPQSKKQPKKVIDTKGIKISKEIEDYLRTAGGSNAEKNIENYKKLLAEFNVPDKYKNEIEKLFKKGYKVSDVLTAYDFLYGNYGQIDELGMLVDKNEGSKDWSKVFKEYNSSNKEFVPRNFESGYLEKLMNTPGIMADDVMISDRLSQKGIRSFEELISSRKLGRNWKDIKTELGVINTEDKLPRVSVSKSQVEKFVKDNGLEEKTVENTLILAGKLGEDDDLAIKKVKEGCGAEDIYAQFYSKKYR